jgi:hypothetical protein
MRPQLDLRSPMGRKANAKARKRSARRLPPFDQADVMGTKGGRSERTEPNRGNLGDLPVCVFTQIDSGIEAAMNFH